LEGFSSEKILPACSPEKARFGFYNVQHAAFASFWFINSQVENLKEKEAPSHYILTRFEIQKRDPSPQ